jgi:hypothetical protein
MTLEIIGYCIAGAMGGSFGTYLFFKFKQIDNNIAALEGMIPTAEEVAREVLKVKIPLDQLPPEMQEEITRQNTATKKFHNPLVG